MFIQIGVCSTWRRDSAIAKTQFWSPIFCTRLIFWYMMTLVLQSQLDSAVGITSIQCAATFLGFLGGRRPEGAANGHFYVHIRQYFFPRSSSIIYHRPKTLEPFVGALVGARRVELRFHDFLTTMRSGGCSIDNIVLMTCWALKGCRIVPCIYMMD
jgi:hypothetical protein